MNARPGLRSWSAALLVGGASLALAPAFAQQGKTAAGASAELRTVYATVPDIIEGKRVADVSCARCHGANGISPTPACRTSRASAPPYLYTATAGLPGARRARRAR